MAELGSVYSAQELLQHELVKHAKCLELSICDAVHFRLTKPWSIFQLAELRLLQRDPDLFAGFADIRTEAEKGLRGSSIKDKIDACCTRKPEWLDVRQILYSTELEVWMDMSYPNPWALNLYHAALVAGKVVSIPKVGPFTDTFHTLLKEKNGYELTKPSLSSDETVQIHVGDQSFMKERHLHLVALRRESRRHPFADWGILASQLAFGLLEKRLEDLSSRKMEDGEFHSRSFGYRLIGPLALLTIQETFKTTGSIAFKGLGAAFLGQLIESIRPSWPWLPVVTQPDHTEAQFSFIHEDKPAPELVKPAIRLFLEAAFNGPAAAVIQGEAAAFVRDFACMTRGLRVILPEAPVLQYLHQRILAPGDDFLAWATSTGSIPGIEPGKVFSAVKRLKNSPWPTATYLLSEGFTRWWVEHRLTPLVQRIVTTRVDYRNS